MPDLAAWLGVSDLGEVLTVGALVAARLAPLTVFAPWLTLRRTPVIVRSGVVLALTVALAPLCHAYIRPEVLDEARGLMLLAWVVREVLVGTLFAIATAVPFYALDWAGRLTDTWRGASLAEVIAPPTGERTSPVGDLYLLMGIAIFVAIGGHRLALAAFAEGLALAPPGDLVLASDALALGAARLTASALAFAVAIAAPAAVSIVVVELALGLLARSAPQVPVFFAGMPLRAAVGLAAALLGLSVAVGELPAAFDAALDTARAWTR